MTMNNPVVKFCPECGKPTVPGMMFCTNCGAKLPVIPVQENAKPVEVKKQEPKKQVVKPVSQPTAPQQNTNVSEVKPAAVKKEPEIQTQPAVKPAVVRNEAQQLYTVHPSVPVGNTTDAQAETVKPVETKKEEQKPVSAVNAADANASHMEQKQSDVSGSQSVPHVTVSVSNGQPSAQNTVNNQTQQNGSQQANAQTPNVTVNVPYNQQYNQPYMNQYQIPLEYQPISAWGYLGYQLLFMIPIVGFILTIVLSFAPNNKNLKNFARSYLLFLIILAVIILIIIAILGNSLYSFFNSIQF